MSFRGLLELAAALSRHKLAGALELTALTNGVHDITNRELLAPERALVAAACRTIGQEFRNVRTDDRRRAAGRWRLRTGWLAPSPSTSARPDPVSTSRIARPEARTPASAVRLPEPARSPPCAGAGPTSSRAASASSASSSPGSSPSRPMRSSCSSAARRSRIARTGTTGSPTRRRPDGSAHPRRARPRGAGRVSPRGSGDVATRRHAPRHRRDARLGPIHGVVHAAGDMSAECFFEIDQVSDERSRAISGRRRAG